MDHSSSDREVPQPARPVHPAPRRALLDLAIYEGGRSIDTVRREHDLTGPVVKLGSNENPYEPLPSVKEAVSRAATELHRYPDYTGEAVRDALAGHLNAPRQNIVLGCGSGHLLQQTFLSYVDPGDEVVYSWPGGFGAHPLFTQLVGGVPVVVGLRDEAIDLESILSRVTPTTKLVCLTNPNNPTSTAFGGSSLTAFLDEVGTQCLVVLDEAYFQYVTLTDSVDGVREALARPNVIVLRTFSKAFGLAALRIGYAVAAAPIVDNLKRTSFPFPINAIAQAAAIASLGAWEELHDRVRAVVSERERMGRELQRRGWPVADSQSNFLWLPMPSSGELATDLEADGVITRAFAGGLRVTVGTREENDAFLRTLRDRQEPTRTPPLAALRPHS